MVKKKLHYLLFLCLVCSFFACSEDEDDIQDTIVGAWQLTSLEVNGTSQDITGQNQIILFEKTSVFKRYFTDGADNGKYRIGGWSLKGDMLNISLDLPAAYYVEECNSSKLSIRRLDIDPDGTLKTTIISYKRVLENLLP